jgi:hypothetical protein
LVVTEPTAAALFIAKPSAAALRLLPLLISAEIEELRGDRSRHAQHQSQSDGQRNQPTALG